MNSVMTKTYPAYGDRGVDDDELGSASNTIFSSSCVAGGEAFGELGGLRSGNLSTTISKNIGIS